MKPTEDLSLSLIIRSLKVVMVTSDKPGEETIASEKPGDGQEPTGWLEMRQELPMGWPEQRLTGWLKTRSQWDTLRQAGQCQAPGGE